MHVLYYPSTCNHYYTYCFTNDATYLNDSDIPDLARGNWKGRGFNLQSIYKTGLYSSAYMRLTY
jgi:hypothetical protein